MLTFDLTEKLGPFDEAFVVLFDRDGTDVAETKEFVMEHANAKMVEVLPKEVVVITCPDGETVYPLAFLVVCGLLMRQTLSLWGMKMADTGFVVPCDGGKPVKVYMAVD